jgi:transposase-like protein
LDFTMSSAEIRAVAQETEVSSKARRRRFSGKYKRKILKAVAACTKPGEIGALLRREGLYSSNLVEWRRAQERGALSALQPKKRGPAAKEVNPLARKVAELEHENVRLQRRAERAEALIAIQKKVSELLGIQLPKQDEES